jgi:hypothetical protein
LKDVHGFFDSPQGIGHGKTLRKEEGLLEKGSIEEVG